MFRMKVKGYSKNGEDPPEQCSKDGVSVGITGYRWFTKLDVFSLNIGYMHFGKKKRGRLDPKTNFFGLGEGMMMKMEDFVPRNLSRRMATSKLASYFDPIGKIAPFLSKPKVLLRETIVMNPSWDDPLPVEMRARWVAMLEELEDLKGMYFHRPRVPKDAQHPLVARLLVGGDAGDDSMISGVWIGFKLQSEGWSCKHLIGKTLLPITSWTIPQKELHTLWMNSQLLKTVNALLGDFLEDKLENKYVFGDSRIALAWTIYESARLFPFHRHRVMQINNEVKEEDSYHCPGNLNPADGGTKIKEINIGMVGPDSVWENGLPWMTKDHEEVMQTLKSAREIKLDDAQPKIAESAEVIKPKFITENKGFAVRISEPELEKYKLRMENSKYLEVLAPQKFQHAFTVRVYSYVLKFIVNSRQKANKWRSENGLKQRASLKIEQSREIRYRIFQYDEVKSEKTDHVKTTLNEMYGTACVVVGEKKK